MSDATMELIKGAKKQAIADDLGEDQNTEAAAETQEVDIEKMTVPQLDALVADNGLEVPDDWKKMNKAAKIAYLQEKYGSDAGGGEAAEADPEPEGTEDTPATAEAVSEAPATAEEAAEEETKAEAKATAKKASKKTAPAKAAVEGEVLGPDEITAAVKQIENLKEDQAKQMAATLQEATAFDQFKLGGVLSVINAHQWYKPYATFKEYVEAELAIQYRRAAYWIKIYNKIIDSGVVWDKVKHIGWTKLKELVDVLTPDNLDEWLKKIEGKNTVTIQQMVKLALAQQAQEATGDEDATVKETTAMTFKVHKDQREIIEQAVAKAKADGSTDVASVALEYICAEYLQGNAKPIWQKLKDMGVDEALKALDQAYPDVNFSVASATEE